MQHPTLLIPFVDAFTCFTGNGMTEAMLEPHLKNEAGATQGQVRGIRPDLTHLRHLMEFGPLLMP